LNNAAKYTEDGGRIWLSVTEENGQLVIHVQDTGVGIAADEMARVFDLFSQSAHSLDRSKGGLGIGLTLVRTLVEMHGGTVAAWSAGKGQGATFKVRLPLVAPMKQPSTAATEPAIQEESGGIKGDEYRTLAGRRILVVEDDPDTLEMLRYILDKYGAVVITAASAKEAIDALERWQPNAIISDIAMPDQDGYDLIAKIRGRGIERCGNIPAIALTAYTRAEDRLHALSAGFQKHLSKPVDPEELITVVASLLQ